MQGRFYKKFKNYWKKFQISFLEKIIDKGTGKNVTAGKDIILNVEK